LVTELNDRHILLMVSEGDETAFKKLFFQWQPFLSSHIFRITGSKELTEEIVQDIFLKIWLTRESLETIESFKAYLIIISRNQALNALRQLAKEARKHKAWEIEQRNPGGFTDHSSFYYTLIDEAIGSLSSRQKEIYLLHRHQRMTYHEIAARLNLSRETIKTHLQHAVANITKFLNSHLAEQGQK
jgi:RNA polymerase sigma factor (sigma-70 family)